MTKLILLLFLIMVAQLFWIIREAQKETNRNRVWKLQQNKWKPKNQVIMFKFVVPVAFVIDDDNYIMPEVRFTTAKEPMEALEKVKQFLIQESLERNQSDDIDEADSVWHYSEPSDEEGYILGDPINLGRVEG